MIGNFTRYVRRASGTASRPLIGRGSAWRRPGRAWQDVGTKLARIYPLSSPEGRAGDLIYNRGMTQADCCLQMHRDRKTVRRYQDAYIMNALLLAVQAGLLRLGGGDGAAEKMD